MPARSDEFTTPGESAAPSETVDGTIRTVAAPAAILQVGEVIYVATSGTVVNGWLRRAGGSAVGRII